MLRLTKQADYAVVLLTQMAGEGPEVSHSARDLAQQVHLPLPIVSKILKILARDGLLRSHRGAKGGYSLERSPEDVSVVEIITAVDGPVGITECIDDTPGECGQESVCPVRGNWQRINEAIRQALEDITLAEMVPPPQQGLVTLGGRRAETSAELN